MTPDEVSDADHEVWRNLFSRGISCSNIEEFAGGVRLDLTGTGWIMYPGMEHVILRDSWEDMREAVTWIVLDNDVSDR
jgi:hypothetical protein